MLWSDESKFNLFGSDGKVVVWRSPKEEFEPECTIPTVKHGSGNVKCWSCFSSSDVDSLIFIDGNMTGGSYREILENNLLKSVEKLGMSHDWIFQHDNDPKHRAAIVANWMNRNGVERLHCGDAPVPILHWVTGYQSDRSPNRTSTQSNWVSFISKFINSF